MKDGKKAGNGSRKRSENVDADDAAADGAGGPGARAAAGAGRSSDRSSDRAAAALPTAFGGGVRLDLVYEPKSCRYNPSD